MEYKLHIYMTKIQTRVLWRCPLCFKISPENVFTNAVRIGGYPPEAMIQSFVGGGRSGRPRDESGKLIPGAKGRGFAWARRPLMPTERAVIVQVLREVADRLADADAHLSEEDFEATAAAYMAYAERALEMARQELAFRQREVDEMQQRIGDRSVERR